MEGEHCSQVGSAQPLSPPCPCPGVPAATSRRRGQPGEGGAALGHAGGPGPQEQGTQRGGGCCPAPRSAGGAQGGALPAPHQLLPPSEPRVPAQVLQRLEARRQQGPEAEAAAVERQMEEARENIRKAEVGPPVRGFGVASRSVTPRVGHAGTGRGGGRDAALGVWCWGCHHAGGGGDGVGMALGVSRGL